MRLSGGGQRSAVSSQTRNVSDPPMKATYRTQLLVVFSDVV